MTPDGGVRTPRSTWLLRGAFSLLLLAFPGLVIAAPDYAKDIHPILQEFCFDCHGDGMSKGQVAFDEFKSDAVRLGKRELWMAVLKNTRAGIMPPEKKPKPSEAQQRMLEEWIKGTVFGIEASNPDPGRVTLRRLNREEYRNTVRDLTGFDFKVEDELPPDDTGYGFDNIGDVLTLSPMLMEKYMQAAENIVAGAVPRVGRMMAEKPIGIAGSRQGPKERRNSDRFSVYEAAKLARTFRAEHDGKYKIALDLEMLGEFVFDPGRVRAVLTVDGREVWRDEFGWGARERHRPEVELEWKEGERKLGLELIPLTEVEKKTNSLDLRIVSMRVIGPMAEKHWVRPRNFELFFSRDVPQTARGRRQYAREMLEKFATRAFRRPVDAKSVDRLLEIAEGTWREKGKRFEDGIAQAIIPVLASPRFLFRVEEVEETRGGKSKALGVPVDEWALASRLSYFLWSTMPDEELFRLASRKELRANLRTQVARMLKDKRADELVENFVGQWLQVRDVEGIDINARIVLSRDLGEERSGRQARQRIEELRDKPELTPDEEKELAQLFEQRKRRFANRPNVELDRDLRRALREETERCFAHVMQENRSVLELLDSDYTFLNERLAKHYSLTNHVGTNFTGGEMRKVQLPPESPRGGVLTHGAVLIVTSNPTRTSPVKRGLFVLDNILGLPPAPPPPDVPLLEDSEKEFAGGRTPTLRETLEIHRSKPLCNSCHNRMDPLGLALENFNALGMWREKERGQAIDAAGKLITGETFQGIRDVKHVLTTRHRRDFYHCLTEKLMTYALGRGLEFYDVHAVDQIVDRLDLENGRFSALLLGIVESAPFQKRRNPHAPADADAPKPVEQRAELKAQP